MRTVYFVADLFLWLTLGTAALIVIVDTGRVFWRRR